MSPSLSRRDWLRLTAGGALPFSLSGWLGNLTALAANNPERKRSCILLWMGGGPSQMDTFDLKPGHKNGGPFNDIRTGVPGIRISEHLPRVARQMDKMVLVRSMCTTEPEHVRGTYLMRTGYVPAGSVSHPQIGSLVAKEIGRDAAGLPDFVSITPRVNGSLLAVSDSGFLGPRYAPLTVRRASPLDNPGDDDALVRSLQVPNLRPPQDMTNRQAEA